MSADRVVEKDNDDQKTPGQESSAHLMGNTWTESCAPGQMGHNSAVSDKRYLCFNHEDGQYIEARDMNRIREGMEDFMQFEAKQISDDNNGAFVMLRGRLNSNYKNSFCSDASVRPDDAMAGTGKLEGPLQLPDADAINKNLNSFMHRYKVSVHGQMPKDFDELDLKADLKITDGDPRKALAEFQQNTTVTKAVRDK